MATNLFVLANSIVDVHGYGRGALGPDDMAVELFRRVREQPDLMDEMAENPASLYVVCLALVRAILDPEFKDDAGIRVDVPLPVELQD